MEKRIISISKYLFFLGVCAFLLYLFYPREYGVLPHKEIAETNYWHLSTGSTIAYNRIPAQGLKKSYPIIYLHGGPGGAISDKTIKMLLPFSEDAYEIYAYDQIGGGSSKRLENIAEYTAERHQADLEEIIKKLEAKKVILIGQSWGSVLATFFAVNNPNKVAKIIMTGSGPVFPLNRSLAALRPPDSLNIKEPIYSNYGGNKEVYTLREKCIDTYAYIFSKKLVSDKQVDDFFTLLNSSLNKSAVYDTSLIKESAGGGGYYAHIMTLKSLNYIEDPREKMKQMKIPILILKGQYDNQKWGYTNEYVDLCDSTELKIIPDAGHFIDLDQPKLYYQEIKDFLALR